MSFAAVLSSISLASNLGISDPISSSVGQIVSTTLRKVDRASEQSVPWRGEREDGKIKRIRLRYCFSGMVISFQNSVVQDRIREISSRLYSRLSSDFTGYLPEVKRS